jgi:hypothetical protein
VIRFKIRDSASGRREVNKRIVAPVAVILILIAIVGCDDDPATITDQRFSASEQTSFAVGNFSTLVVENYVGNVTITSGGAGVIIIVATKWAEYEDDLTKITIDINADANMVDIITDIPSDVVGGAVDFEITIPPDVGITVYNGVGNTSYTGRALGANFFDTGVGSIRLNLPSDINVEVELSVGIGTILLDFPVSGQVSQHAVIGVIGTGADGGIYAEVGVGNLRLDRQ